MEGSTNLNNLNCKKDDIYYAFLRTARSEISKELTVAAENKGSMVTFHPNIGLKLQGVFEHGEEKKSYEVHDHHFMINRVFKSQQTKIVNPQIRTEKYTVKGINYYSLDKDTYYYFSPFNNRLYLNVRVVKDYFMTYTKEGVSFSEYEVNILNHAIGDITQAVAGIADGDCIKFDIGFYKQIQYNPAQEELEMYKMLNEQRDETAPGIILRGEAIQKFLDLFLVVKSTTNEFPANYPSGEVIVGNEGKESLSLPKETAAEALFKPETDPTNDPTNLKRKTKLAEKKPKRVKTTVVDNASPVSTTIENTHPKYEFS